MEPHTRLILVRHGETTANTDQRWYGALDAPLTSRGMGQVAATGARFAAWRHEADFSVLYASPLPRCRTTAAAIAQALELETLVEDGLREFSIGDWEGRTFRDLHDTEQLWDRFAADPDFAPPNGESPRSFGRRVMGTVEDIANRHPGESIIVVTHGGVISRLLDVWLGGNNGDWVRWDPHNCAVTVVEWDGAAWRGLLVNDVTHLAPELVATALPEYAQ
jgi:broad specificity phosphatase PhoE